MNKLCPLTALLLVSLPVNADTGTGTSGGGGNSLFNSKKNANALIQEKSNSNLILSRISNLKDPDSEVRGAAMDKIAESPDVRYVRPIIRVLSEDTDEGLRTQAASVLASLKVVLSDPRMMKEAISALQKSAWSDKNVDTRTSAMAALVEVQGIAAVPQLSLMVNSNSEKAARIYAISSLSKLKAVDAISVKSIVTALSNDPAEDVRSEAAKTLCAASPKKYIRELDSAGMLDQSFSVRAIVLGCLSSVNDPSLVKVFTQNMNESLDYLIKLPSVDFSATQETEFRAAVPKYRDMTNIFRFSFSALLDLNPSELESVAKRFPMGRTYIMQTDSKGSISMSYKFGQLLEMIAYSGKRDLLGIMQLLVQNYGFVCGDFLHQVDCKQLAKDYETKLMYEFNLISGDPQTVQQILGYFYFSPDHKYKYAPRISFGMADPDYEVLDVEKFLDLFLNTKALGVTKILIIDRLKAFMEDPAIDLNGANPKIKKIIAKLSQ